MSRSPPVYAPTGHEHTTPTHMHQYTHWSMLLYSVLLSCITPAYTHCFISDRAVFLLYLYSSFTPALLLFCNCCNPVLLKCMHVYTRALLLLDYIFVRVLQSKGRKRHLALVFKGLHALKHSTVELKHITTPTKLLAGPGVVSVTIQFLLLYIYIYIYIYMLYLCFTPASPLLIHVTAAILLYLHIFIYTPILLVLYS
jgi:hypothetical protein